MLQGIMGLFSEVPVWMLETAVELLDEAIRYLKGLGFEPSSTSSSSSSSSTSSISTTPTTTTKTTTTTTKPTTKKRYRTKFPQSGTIPDFDYSDPDTSTPKLTTLAPCQDNGAVFPDEYNCNGYFSCSNNLMVHKRCPPNGYWNCYQKRCGLIKLGECCSKDPRGSIACPQNGMRIPVSTDDTKYLECVNYQIVEKTCSPPTKFNSTSLICN